MGIRNTGTKKNNLKNGVAQNFGLGSKNDRIRPLPNIGLFFFCKKKVEV